MVVLANYDRGDNHNVIIPYAAGCQTIGIYPYQEAQVENALRDLTQVGNKFKIKETVLRLQQENFPKNRRPDYQIALKRPCPDLNSDR